ncbi:hypothetical protein Goari_019461 [Gossypium aridum]|uniref:DUF4283 domain-containing protein n=1 Tax=Gossypium aridum TaxID=34290 RepID=A0A7J8WU59_GOSAI|nr:hypothetical protein [Gossypium aridum]
MEKELVDLSLDDEEDEILQAQMDLHFVFVEIDLCLVGCFLTASVIHFPAMRSTMANIWHLVKGAQISDLGEEMFLFKFFHKMDPERVLKGFPWTFNNHLLMLHWLEKEEDPLKVPLIFVCFWVQIHEVPLGFYIETLTCQIEGFLRNFLEFDGTNLGKRRIDPMLGVNLEGDLNLVSCLDGVIKNT